VTPTRDPGAVYIDDPSTLAQSDRLGCIHSLRHKHYGKGQTADDIALPPGKHTLSLVFANANHQSYGPKFSESVVVVVK